MSHCEHLLPFEIGNPEHGEIYVGDEVAIEAEWCQACGALRLWQDGEWQAWRTVGGTDDR